MPDPRHNPPPDLKEMQKKVLEEKKEDKITSSQYTKKGKCIVSGPNKEKVEVGVSWNLAFLVC